MFRNLIAGFLAVLGIVGGKGSEVRQEPENTPLTQILPNNIGLESTNSPVFEEIPVLATSTEETIKEITCVDWARANSKIQPPRIDYAKNLPITHNEARIGSWIIFGGNGIFGALGHTGLIRFVNPDNKNIVTWEGHNYPKGQHKIMTINIEDKKYDFLGYFDNRQN